MRKNREILFPLVVAIAVIIGIYVGKNYDKLLTSSTIVYSGSNKIDGMLNIISNQYVDPIDIDSIIEKSMPKIIGELDPHSTYISAKDLAMVNEDLEGSFSGIGVQFNLLNDTVTIVNVIPGGPSEMAGVIAGDRIIAVNDTAFTGKDITNEKVMKKLRGAKGSEVTLTLARIGSDNKNVKIKIIRGDIPLHSVDISFRTGEDIGYIKVSKFGSNTYNEFIGALAKLYREGATKFIIDMRGNSGGYMEAAINMVNEFLPSNQLIVYTYGEHSSTNKAYSNGTGAFKDNQVVILTDEWSASASEIFAGAIQDNDRGLIVGRRSYGKGLVQQQLPFSDGSAIRLTIARYYTPSGRSIQKEYKMGDNSNYEMDIVNRFEHGEFDSQDSIQVQDSIKYTTRIGRTVYGGGGIMPDIFVPRDTLGYSPYLTKVINDGLLYQFAFKYADENRETLSKFKDANSILKHLKSKPILTEFISFASKKGITPRPVYINISKGVINNTLYAYIARNIIGDEAFYPIILMEDKTFLKAVDVLDKNQGFPTIDNDE